MSKLHKDFLSTVVQERQFVRILGRDTMGRDKRVLGKV